MEQAVSKNRSNRGLRERVEARRSRAEKIVRARAVFDQEVAALKASSTSPVMPPHFASQQRKRSFVDRLLELAGNQPAGTQRETRGGPSVAYLRGTPSHTAPPPVGLPAYVPASRDPLAAYGPVPEPLTRRRQRSNREPMPLPFFVPLVIEFLVAVAVVAALGFFILTITRGILHLPDLKIGGGGQPAAEQAAARRAEAIVQATAAAQAALPDQPVTVLLMGSDRRAGDNGFRTDVMLLLTIDAKNRRVNALSFPRDLVGKIPGYGDGRINIVMGQGGFEAVQGTFSDSYGVKPHYYFLINFEGFVGLVNSIGGIEIDASEPLEDSCDLYWSRGGICRVEAGKFEMDGDTALWYVRSRHSSSDFDRTRRAQEVAMGIFSRMMDMRALTRLPELYAQYSQDVETNMGIGQMMSLLPVAAKIAQDRSLIQRYNIPQEITADWIMADGGRVLLPDYDAVREIVKEATFQK